MRYDCIVIGGGSAGLTVSTGLAGANKKVLLVEKDKLGGECTWRGCIPSKTFINLSKQQLDIKEILKKVRRKMIEVGEGESVEVLKEKGIDIVSGIAKFISEDTIMVEGREYKAKDIVIATGSKSFIPPIEGLEDINYLTNANIFEQKTIQKKLGIIGGGVISLELSFALKRVGIDVTILERADKLVPMEDDEVSKFYIKQLERNDIKLYLECTKLQLEKIDNEIKVITNKGEFLFDQIFISTGRISSIDELDLEKAGVEYDKKGIKVDEHLLTNKKHIYAIGDVVGPYRFSHIAGYHGELVVRNILFPYVKKKVDYSSVPWTIYSNIEFSRTGLNETEAKEKYKEIKIYTLNAGENERSIVESESEFMLKVICNSKYKIIGAYCIGKRAGEIIGLLQFMKSQNLKFYKILDSIQSYPTYIDSIRKLAKKSYIEHLKELIPVISENNK